MVDYKIGKVHLYFHKDPPWSWVVASISPFICGCAVLYLQNQQKKTFYYYIILHIM